MKRIRMFDWIVVTILLTIAVGYLAPDQLKVSLYKLSLVTLAAVFGYWIDRSLFPYARPDDLINRVGNKAEAAMIRRAIIVAACIIGVALGA